MGQPSTGCNGREKDGGKKDVILKKPTLLNWPLIQDAGGKGEVTRIVFNETRLRVTSPGE